MIDVDRLWAGWRLAYVQDAGKEETPPGAGAGVCIFCRMPDLPDEEALRVDRAERAFTVLNLYPYNTAHVMIIPNRHVADLDELSPDEAADVMHLTQRALRAIKAEYGPDGANIGANLGRAAGAGIPRHFHMHALPRWAGDTNYITVVGGAKVMPEEIGDTYRRLSARMREID